MIRKVLLTLSLCLPLHAFGWGALGHRVTAEIAYRHLSPAAKAQCDRLLAGDSFPNVASWADQVKKVQGWQQTAWYHFTSVPDGVDYITYLAHLPTEQQNLGDVVMGILKAETILRNPQSDAQSKQWALKFIIHWVGDIHQPLHSGRPADRGGNDIPVTWFGQAANLHELWDTMMVATAHANDLNGKTPTDQGVWYANYLEQTYQSTTRGQPVNDVLYWLNESLAIRSGAYQGYAGDNTAYLTKSIPTLEIQLVRGGYHLAVFLNNIFAGTPPTPQEKALRSGMDQAVKRPFESIILLSPKANFGSRLFIVKKKKLTMA